LPYLNDLVSIIRVHVFAIYSTIEYLEIPLVYMDRPPLPLLPPFRQIVRIDLVEEGHHPSLATILFENSGTPIP